MKQITFEFKDAYTHGEWRRQCCIVPSLDDCIKWYGLGEDCEYRIVEVKEITR